MKPIISRVVGNRKIEIYDRGNTFEIFCFINDNLSRAFPVKAYKYIQAANKYANKFFDYTK